MKFTNVADAFNYYRNFTSDALEKRAQEIKGTISTDPNVDINSINIELEAIKQAKDNNTENESRSANNGFSVVMGMSGAPAKKTFDRETVCDTPEYRSAFFKNMLGQTMTADERSAFDCAIGEAEKRADAFNTSSNSVAVLPTETLNEVVAKARTIGGLMGECRAFNIPTKIAVPVGTPATKGAWHVEGADIETENATVATVSFDGYEIVKIISISAKVRKMSIPAFEKYLVEEITNCVMETIADALVNGTGVNMGSGLETISWVKGTNAVEIGATAKWKYADVVSAVAMLKRGYSSGAKFAMNNATLFNTFYGMTDTNERPIFVADPKADNVGKILGFDVVIDDNIANDVVYFGNFGKYMGYNMPDGIVVEISRESAFRKGLIDYRAMAIADCKPIVADAFVKIYKANA